MVVTHPMPKPRTLRPANTKLVDAVFMVSIFSRRISHLRAPLARSTCAGAGRHRSRQRALRPAGRAWATLSHARLRKIYSAEIARAHKQSFHQRCQAARRVALALAFVCLRSCTALTDTFDAALSLLTSS